MSQKLSIGRNPQNDLVINDPLVSSFHATITETYLSGEIRFELTDNHSTNGTFVNSKKIEKCFITENDKIRVGNSLVQWQSYFVKNNSFEPKAAPQVKVEKREVVAQRPAAPESRLEKPANKKKKRYLVPGIIAATLVVLLGVGAFLLKDQFAFNPSEDYKNSVVLIYHSYVYKVTAGENILYITNVDGELVMYDEAKTPPIAKTGTGFIVSEDGKIITNRHVALPWEYDEDIEKIKEGVKTSITESISSKEELLWAVKNVGDLKVEGQTVFLGIGYNDTYINGISDFDECIMKRESGDHEVDVALIQLKSKTIPDKIDKFIDLNDAVVDYNVLKLGDEVFMLGYPAGFTVGDTEDGLKVNFQSGKLTREADHISVGHNIPTIGGGSGSPIFDKHGHLIAVNYAGLSNTQGFNFGIVSKHAVSLVK